jgi:hypothetical protein
VSNIILVLAAPFAFLFRVLKWLIKHPFMIALIIMVIIICFGLSRCNAVKSNTRPVQLEDYQKSAPDISLATKVLVTKTRAYYLVTYDTVYNGDRLMSATIYEYYLYDKKWEHVTRAFDDPLIIDRKYYGDLSLYDNWQ